MHCLDVFAPLGQHEAANMADVLKASQSSDFLSTMLTNIRQAIDSGDLRSVPLPALLASSGFIALLFVLLLARRSAAQAPAKALIAGMSFVGNKLPRGTKTVLLVGPLGAGKTTLFSKVCQLRAAFGAANVLQLMLYIQLVYGSAPQTFTSSTTNTALIMSDIAHDGDAPTSLLLPKPLFLADVPGHPRLRARELAQALPSADGVVFVLDATKAWTMRGSQEASE